MQYSILNTKNKIQKTPRVLMNISKGIDPNIILMCSKDDSVDEFVELSKLLVFHPNSVKKVYFPNRRFTSVNTPNPIMVNDTSMALQKFSELKTFQVQFNRIDNPNTDLKALYTSSKPILLDIGMYRSVYNNFVISNHKNAATGLKVFVTLLKHLEESYSLGKKNKDIVTFYQLDKDFDPFLQAIQYALQVKNKEALGVLGKLNIFLTAHNNYVYKLDLKNLNDIAIKRSEINRLIDIAKQPMGGISVNDVKEVEEYSGDTSEIPLQQDHVVDELDKDQSKLEPTGSTDNLDDTNLDEPVGSVNTDSEIPLDDEESSTTNAISNDLDAEFNDTNTIELPSENEEAEEEVEVLSDLASIKADTMGNTELELQAIAKENKTFLDKNLKLQEKALASFKAEAEALAKDKELDKKLIDDPNILNKGVKEVGLTSITIDYYKKQYRKDIVDIITTLNNDPEYPVVVTKFEITDNSSALSMVDTYKIEFLDKKYKRHTFTVDVPRLSNDGFLYINGNKKFIAKQALPIPVIKETHDRVQITTNYRKVFLYRKGEKTSSYGDKILKVLISSDFKSINKTLGDSTTSNSAYKVSITYSYLSKKLYKVEFLGDKSNIAITTFVFNQDEIRRTLKDSGFTFDDTKYIPVGYISSKGGKPTKVYLEDLKDRKIYSSNGKDKPTLHSDSLVTILQKTLEDSAGKDEELLATYNKIKPSLRLSYTDVKIASTSVALGPLIAMYKGLLPALDLYGIKYTVNEKRVTKKTSETILAFKDVFLYIDSEHDNAKEIFINGLLFLDCANYNLNESGMYSGLYLDYLEDNSGSRNVSKALNNFEHSMIDPITLEILESLNLPKTFPELLLYGNTLLGSLEKNRKNNMNHFRIRDSEVLSVSVYNVLMDSFNNYKRSMRSGVVEPISAKRDAVVLKVQEAPNIEDYSILNPFQEAEIKSKTTFKGPSGLNASQAYTSEIRAYHESMLGLYGLYTPIGPEVGVNRSMVINPKIKTTRGLIQDFDVESADTTSLFSIGELLNVFTPKHSDTPRGIMASVQGKHITPTKVQSPYIIGNGTDKALAHMIGNDFARKASEDGVIESINPKTQLMVVKYKDGTKSIVNLKGNAAKNGGGGFYTENKLDLVKGLKVGSKVKKGQILAIDRNFFKEMLDGSIGFASGALTKVAVVALPETFEDSSVITNKVVNDLSSEIISDRKIILNKSTRIIKSAKIGDTVSTQDPLLIFEDIGSDEKSSLFSDFEKLDDSSKDFIEEYARSVAKAKYSGEIYDIHIYYNCELEDMHPSLRELVLKYTSINKMKAKVMESGRKDEINQLPSIEKINSTKILGNEVDGVLIQYFIKYTDKFKVGDKCCFSIALKTIVSQTIEEGKEPYSSYDPSESVDAILSPLSIVSRMVSDFYLGGYSTKLVIELEKQCLKLLSE